MEESQAVNAFGALAQPTRLAILRHLVAAGPTGAAAGEIGAALDIAPSRLSFHIAHLERAGLVTSERQSRRIVYRAAFEGVRALVRYLVEDCCANDPKLAGCCP